MLALLGYGLIALVVAAVIFYLIVAFLPQGLRVIPERDERPFALPADRRMVPADLDTVRIPVAVRGYRFAETDELIDRLTAEITVRDEEIESLRDELKSGGDAQPGEDAQSFEEALPGEDAQSFEDAQSVGDARPGEDARAHDV